MIARLFLLFVLAMGVVGCASTPSDGISLPASGISGFGVELRRLSAMQDGDSIQTVGIAKRSEHFGLIDAHLHLEFLDDRENLIGEPIEKRLPSMRRHRGWEPLMRFSWSDEVPTPLPAAVRVSVKAGAVGSD